MKQIILWLKKGISAMWGNTTSRWLIIFAIFAIIAIGRMAYLRFVKGYGWIDTGFGAYTTTIREASGTTSIEVHPAKTLWDWMDLLVMPVVLAVGVWLLNHAERASEQKIARQRIEEDRKIAEDRVKETTLQNYLDRMEELLLEHHLKDTKGKEDEISVAIRDVAQVRTITTLRTLDRERRNIVLQFLRDADLADFVLVGANLNKASLNGAELWGINLKSANLDKADLLGADLNRSNLIDAKLYKTNLNEANLAEVDLSGANMRGATLNGTCLRKANLSKVNLSEADISGATLIEANLSGAHMLSVKNNKSNLIGSDLRKADLSFANFRDVKMGATNLSDAILCEASLSGVILENADLSRVNLYNAKVSEKQLANVRTLQGATMPDGSRHA
jgi:uncharacterized protein YjbI with pentapeptide repeats